MRFPFRQLALVGLALISWPAAGQESIAKPLFPAVSNPRLLTRDAGYIFDGTVLSVERSQEDESSGVPTVRITFRVEQAIRGTRVGQVLTIREWAGLWNSGERYRRGERLLLFLYRPSKMGLTSPVGGPLGRFTVDSGGNAVLQSGRITGLPLNPSLPAQLREKKRVNARALALAIQRADSE